MEHLTLTIRGQEANGFWAITNKEGNQGEDFYEEVQTLERATKFVNCWNHHDELLDACKAAEELLDYIQQKYSGSPTFSTAARLIKSAILSAESEV